MPITPIIPRTMWEAFCCRPSSMCPGQSAKDMIPPTVFGKELRLLRDLDDDTIDLERARTDPCVGLGAVDLERHRPEEINATQLRFASPSQLASRG